jgi:hypothetical protein
MHVLMWCLPRIRSSGSLNRSCFLDRTVPCIQHHALIMSTVSHCADVVCACSRSSGQPHTLLLPEPHCAFASNIMPYA